MKSGMFRLLGRGLIAAALMAGVMILTAGAAPLVSWKMGPTSPFAYTRFDGETVAGITYFLGGRMQDNSTDGTIWKFDGTNFTQVGMTMPTPISNYKIAMLTDANGNVGLYTFGGRDNSGNIITDVQTYYPATNTVAVDTADPWPGTTPSNCVSLPAMGVAVVGNKAVVVGGASFSSSGCVDDNSAQTWIYDPAAAAGSRWTQGPSLNVARGYITTATIGKKIFAIGGDVNNAGVLSAIATVEVLSRLSGHWSDKNVADLPEPCDESQAFGFSHGMLANHVILAGCGQWPSALADSWNLDYTIAPGTWTATTPLNVARRNQAGAIVGRDMFVLGGYDSSGANVLNSSEESRARPPLGPTVPQTPGASPAPASNPTTY